ncbi:MAG: acyl-CoA dehydrogenase, partial [Acidimicrobiales bacterium]|nr:acyl-CoA dehydrogenase [Acidimicrobiales bacterium]
MDYEFDEGAERLRRRLRDLIEDHFPDDFLGAFTDDPADLALTQKFCKTLANEGLLTRAWPDTFGGGGGSVWEQTVVREEMWAHHEPRGAQYMGLNWVGPALMQFGSPGQQAAHLPPIAAGEVIWCQGFSEPEAGSDLASLRTRAVPTDGGWLVSGQKIWTSYAQMAQWCVLAARTSSDGPKQEGITMFLVPMGRPGVSVRPIVSMLGPHHLNEVFLDEVFVGPEDVLGDVGGGWTVIREALKFERVGIARYARCDRLLHLVREELGDAWDELPGALRARWTRALVHVRNAALLAYRVVAAQDAGTLSDVDASIARVATTLCDQEVAEILFEAIGSQALDNGQSSHPMLHGAVEDHWRYAQ